MNRIMHPGNFDSAEINLRKKAHKWIGSGSSVKTWKFSSLESRVVIDIRLVVRIGRVVHWTCFSAHRSVLETQHTGDWVIWRYPFQNSYFGTCPWLKKKDKPGIAHTSSATYMLVPWRTPYNLRNAHHNRRTKYTCYVISQVAKFDVQNERMWDFSTALVSIAGIWS